MDPRSDRAPVLAVACKLPVAAHGDRWRARQPGGLTPIVRATLARPRGYVGELGRWRRGAAHDVHRWAALQFDGA